ncbi:MAG TPA: NAD(+)/NADH kinase [Gemmatimonadales bacterium]|nr:NAD(+)/NADH kinase [Gemmatimonadales bacterium]
MKIGVCGNHRYPELRALLEQLATLAPERGISLYSEERLADLWPKAPPDLEGVPLDVLLTFGGDGTLLRGARMLEGRGIPILGINLGKVGFLTSVSRNALPAALDALVAGRYTTEPRQALKSFVLDADGQVTPLDLALNDVVVHKGGVARVIRLDVVVQGESVGPYSADGIIVATPTGSTAYSLSAGGPIVVPGVQALVITPICAHTLAVRPLVFPASWDVVIQPADPEEEEIIVSVDGQVVTHLAPGARVRVRVAEAPVLLVRVGPEGYFQRMRQKLHWGDLSDRTPI